MYDYSKLKGRIIEKFDSYKNFAEALGLTSASLSVKLKGRVSFSQKDIEKILDLLDLDREEINTYFFNKKE